MRLNDRGLQDRAFWEKAGIELPCFDRAAMMKATKEAPRWIHFGAGNIFRAFPAALAQTLLEQGMESTGIVAVVRYDKKTITECFGAFDNVTILVTLTSDGTVKKKVIAGIASYRGMDEDRSCLKEIFTNPSLQMASFTITEKGYEIDDRDVAEDIETGPGNPHSYLGRVAALCHERYTHGAPPLALVSMDNCSRNGDRLFAAIETFAAGWVKNGRADPGFGDYVRDRNKLSFPWSMIDKITPGPDAGIKKLLVKDGLEDIDTAIAPFVNAEETEYLLIEDAFPNGRPALEKAGVLFTDRETVDKVEKMKVCACLNPLHTALAVFGCLLGYTRISDEMKNPDLVTLVKGIGYREGLPVAPDPGIINPREFIDTVIQKRLPNPFLPDSPRRIACDTSQKISVRFGETIKAYRDGKAEGKTAGDLTLIPLVLAAWLRYLMGIDDACLSFAVSPDPLYAELASLLAGINLGDTGPFRAKLEPILSNSKIFGVNLYEAGIAEKVEAYFEEFVSGPGAVAKTLRRYVGVYHWQN